MTIFWQAVAGAGGEQSDHMSEFVPKGLENSFWMCVLYLVGDSTGGAW